MRKQNKNEWASLKQVKTTFAATESNKEKWRKESNVKTKMIVRIIIHRLAHMCKFCLIFICNCSWHSWLWLMGVCLTIRCMHIFVCLKCFSCMARCGVQCGCCETVAKNFYFVWHTFTDLLPWMNWMRILNKIWPTKITQLHLRNCVRSQDRRRTRWWDDIRTFDRAEKRTLTPDRKRWRSLGKVFLSQWGNNVIW